MVFCFFLDIGAHPESVNVLEGSARDVRTPDKLIDGVNETLDGRHMWLAPILPGKVLNDDDRWWSLFFSKNSLCHQ